MKRPKLFELLKKKELDPQKKAELEKGDYLALVLAALSVFVPVLLGVLAIFALVAWLFVGR